MDISLKGRKLNIINFSDKLNVMTGYNNSRKTTILEVILLWNEFYIKLMYKTTVNDKKGQVRIGYAPTTRASYFDYNNIII
jgi:predicted ATP-dependent endonuclease of OLD family